MSTSEMQFGQDSSPQITRAVTIVMTSEVIEGTVPTQVTEALASVLVRAARINHQYEKDFDLSFSSLLLGVLASHDPVSVWFTDNVRRTGAAIDALLEKRHLDRGTLTRIASQNIERGDFDRTFRQTRSVVRLFETASGFRRQISGADDAPLDVRHLLAAYIYDPAGHERDLEELRFARPAWSEGFLALIRDRYPLELEGWIDLHRRTFPNNPPLITDAAGPSTHIATDVWTLDDALGYRAYAYAIYRFLTHPRTKPPLTISIQAPWGGGKTSLMRMVQKLLDPDALAAVQEGAKQRRGAFTVREALEVLDNWIRNRTQEPLPSGPESQKRPCATIWFNAWKYESVNQVWAGLVDAVMQQIAARLTLVERERFWLLLNLKRVDTERIRNRIYERIFNYFWRSARGWIAVAGTAALASTAIALSSAELHRLGLGGIALSTAAGGIASAVTLLKAKKKVKDEPAAVSLAEYLDIPDYSKELGQIHHIEADLRRVLASVPERYERLVIFVDDLDRCSPAKVAQVVEAVNLFLAGEFPKCFFVLGMDAEMVAAALQAAHKDMIAQLPPDAGIPVGWRFMDKFVQLPFLIPPAGEPALKKYASVLFATDDGASVDAEVDRIARQAANRVHTRTALDAETKRIAEAERLDPVRTVQLQHRLEEAVMQRTLEEGIDRFSDSNPEIREMLGAAATVFQGNPRELKRFVNAFRFHYFLWWAHRARGVESPSAKQLLRWTILSIKWPDVVRWLRRGGAGEWRPTAQPAAPAGIAVGGDAQPKTLTVESRLKLIEDLSANVVDLSTWQQAATQTLRLDAKATPWLADDDLLQFMSSEGQLPAGERLSAGVGKGLW